MASTTFKIAPVDRLEGHLDLEVTTDVNTVVSDVKNIVVMFRGIENIMVKRDPRDAPIIAPRT
jgi:Ni,Fe-hydrogenase I large subunit